MLLEINGLHFVEKSIYPWTVKFFFYEKEYGMVLAVNDNVLIHKLGYKVNHQPATELDYKFCSGK